MDVALLLITRILRMFAYGFLSVVLVLYLVEVGLSPNVIGLLLTLTLIGDAGISLMLTASADRVGRRRVLVWGSFLMTLTGWTFARTTHPVLLTVAATLGVLSPTGNETGPFLPVEQAALAQCLSPARRVWALAWYNLVGSFATALGALSGGWLTQVLQGWGISTLASYRTALISYAVLGIWLGLLYLSLSRRVEATPIGGTGRRVLGLHRSRKVVLRISVLFTLDALAGGFVPQSLLAYWFHAKFGVGTGLIGSIFFGANVLGGISALAAAWIARSIGLLRTMVFTHLPSNVLLGLVPLMPSLSLAIGVLLLRFSLSQMDVPTRQAYITAVVAPDERSAALGVTTIARSVGASLSPALSGLCLATSPTAWLFNAPFFIAGSLKVLYDLLLYRSFRFLEPFEHEARSNRRTAPFGS